jgi:hypothetical protein
MGSLCRAENIFVARKLHVISMAVAYPPEAFLTALHAPERRVWRRHSKKISQKEIKFLDSRVEAEFVSPL